MCIGMEDRHSGFTRPFGEDSLCIGLQRQLKYVLKHRYGFNYAHISSY